MAIPKTGRSWDELRGEMESAKAQDYSWRRGRMALYFYFLDEALMRVQQEAYAAYWMENNMAHRAFPSLKRLEEEVIAAGLSLLNAPPGAGGTFTSGGSESIFLALCAARNRARAERGVTAPNIVVPRTAHLTFSRAADFLGIEVRRVPTGEEFRADLAGMERRIDADTIALVGSAPNYPFGAFDPIGEIAALAERRGLWMHVDACVGGFLAPWVRRLGYSIPEFDLGVPGVTSVSADLHKYGMAAKGASLLLVRDAALREWHRFESRDWERGPYVSYTTQGSRPGGAVAAAWAVLNYLGEDGYMRCAERVMGAMRAMTEGIEAIPGLEVLRPHELCIFVYRSTDPALDIGAVAAGMDRRGWFVGRQQEPDGIHLALNPVHAEIAEEYLADLREVVAEVKGAAARPMERATAAATY